MNRQNVLEPSASCCRSIIFGALVLMPVIESALNGTATDRKRTKNREWEQRKWEKNERKEYHTFHSKWTNVLFVEFRWFAPPVVSWASVEKVFRIKFAKTKSITIHAVRLKYKHQQHWPGRCEVIFGCLNFTFSVVWINRVIKQIKNGTKAFRKDLDERPNRKKIAPKSFSCFEEVSVKASYFSISSWLWRKQHFARHMLSSPLLLLVPFCLCAMWTTEHMRSRYHWEWTLINNWLCVYCYALRKTIWNRKINFQNNIYYPRKQHNDPAADICLLHLRTARLNGKRMILNGISISINESSERVEQISK